MNRGAQLLAEYRKANELTQMDIAHTLRTSPQRISKLECGRMKPGRASAVAIAEATGGHVPADAWDKPAVLEAPDDAPAPTGQAA